MSGPLGKNLFGNNLRIGDKLFVDRELNVYAANVTATNMTTTLFTSKIVEKESMEGIMLCGNLHVQDGSFITGNVDLTGTVMGDMLAESVTVSGGLSVAGIVRVREICSDSELYLNSTSIRVPKSTTASNPPLNEVTTTTPAGLIHYETFGAELPPNQSCVLRMINSSIKFPSSVVFAQVGTYYGLPGYPMVWRTDVGDGYVDIYIVNVNSTDDVPIDTQIPIRYLII